MSGKAARRARKKEFKRAKAQADRLLRRDPLVMSAAAQTVGRAAVRCDGCGEVQINTASGDLPDDDERLAAPCRFCPCETAVYA